MWTKTTGSTKTMPGRATGRLTAPAPQSAATIRNVAVGHSGAGKTTLVEQLLAATVRDLASGARSRKAPMSPMLTPVEIAYDCRLLGILRRCEHLAAAVFATATGDGLRSLTGGTGNVVRHQLRYKAAPQQR